VARVLKQEDLWLKTCIALQVLVEKAPRGNSKVIRMKLGAWIGVGKAVGLIEPALSHQGYTQDNKSSETESIPRQDKSGCWYGRCGRHGKIDEETEWMLLRCAGCKKARYCSKECQSVDWKIGHKAECRSMKQF
jgi:MYND finger